jgi:2-keto-4-pentenoate hydratase/2-oxohepta-3-ene-1,7-dioic acid hydratase in catechol pathway
MRFANDGGRSGLLVGDEVFDLERISGGAISSDPMVCIAEQWDAVREVSLRGAFDGGVPVTGADLRAPVPSPSAIFGLVANYPPATRTVLPMVFAKSPSSLVGPYDDIVLPDASRLPMRNEWTVLEAELAFVVGRGGRRIDPSDALDALAGFTVAQDVTERVHEFGPRGTSVGTMDYAALKTLGKSMDTFCPLGPAIVTLDELDDPNDLQIECRLNREIVQKSSTKEMLASVSDLVGLLSTFVSLHPGDVCLTGTPTPLDTSLPRLHPGDIIETDISGIGLLRNTCVREEV